MMFLMEKKEEQFKPNQGLVKCLPLFYY